MAAGTLFAATLAALGLVAMSQVQAQKSTGEEIDSRWQSVFKSPERRVWLDAASVEREGSVVTFWLQHRLMPAQRGQILDRWAIDCRARTSWPLEAMAYDERGRQTRVAAAPASPLKVAIAPESNLEVVMACVCGASA
jgi:hypothetical protein